MKLQLIINENGKPDLQVNYALPPYGRWTDKHFFHHAMETMEELAWAQIQKTQTGNIVSTPNGSDDAGSPMV